MTDLTRDEVLAYRLRVNHLAGDRLGEGSLTRAAHAGLQDGSPRSALLSLAARVEGVRPDDWRAGGLAQVFGPRGAIYVVPATDVGVFTLGLLPRDPGRVAALAAAAEQIHEVLGGESMRQSDVVAMLPDLGGSRALRWAATLGTLNATWDTVDTIVHPAAPPDVDAEEARLELARRFFRYLGPATVQGLQWWLAGLHTDAVETVAALGDELSPVTVAGRECLALAQAGDDMPGSPDPDAVLLLPPDDVYINRLSRDLLVPDPALQKRLWPQAPPPGALVVGGEVVGTWRRRGGSIAISAWSEVAAGRRSQAEAIAAEWPLEVDGGEITVQWGAA